VAKKLHFGEDYARHRAREYPIAGDALDAILKGFEAVRESGIMLPKETEDWIAACRGVKARIKKPAGK
jgi:hypothetical protein